MDLAGFCAGANGAGWLRASVLLWFADWRSPKISWRDRLEEKARVPSPARHRGNKQPDCTVFLFVTPIQQGESAMKRNAGGKRPSGVRILGIAALGAILASSVAHANPSNRIVLVPPTDLPALARQGGEAMFLHDTWDGRTLLYVEQRRGAQLAIFDVTDPAHVKGNGSAQLNAAGPFDFVAALGERAELVRFRRGQEDAVLDLHKVPTLRRLQGLQVLQGVQVQTSPVLLGNGSSPLAGPAIVPAMDQSVRDFQVLESGKSRGDDRIIEVKQVRQAMTNADTGTTFLLAEKGLYLIRRPALEAAPATAPAVYLHPGG